MLRQLSLLMFTFVFVTTNTQIALAGDKAKIEIEEGDDTVKDEDGLNVDNPKKDDTGEKDDEPGLKLPTDPKDPKKKPVGPKRPKITAIPDNKMFDGNSCILTDSDATPTIMGAIDGLVKAMNAVDQCAQDPNLKASIETANALKLHGQKVADIFEKRDELMSNAKMAADYQKSLEALLAGADKISQGIGKNPLVSSACGQKMMSTKDITLAFSDLISQLSPLVVLGGSAGLLVKGALLSPIALKILGVGAFFAVAAKAYTYAVKSDSVDMTDFTQQEALRKNLCEYAKVVKRVNFIQDSLAGADNKIDENAGASIVSYEKDRNNFLKTLMTARVIELDKSRSDARAILSSNLTMARKHQTTLRNIKAMAGTDANKICIQGKLLIKNLGQTNNVPYEAVKNLKDLMAKQDKVTFEQQNILEQEALLRTEMKAAITLDSAKCAEKTISYLSSLEDIIKETRTRVASLEAKIEANLSKDSEYKVYLANKKAIDHELQARKVIRSVLVTLGKPQGDVELSQMLKKMRMLTQAFFYRSGLGTSPVANWLEEYSKEFRTTLDEVGDEFNSLVSQSKTHTDMFLKNADGSYKLDARGNKILPKGKELQEMYKNSMTSAESLGFLTTYNIPKGSNQHKMVCGRLNNAYLKWHAAKTHLRSQKLLCEFIEPFRTADSMESEVTNKCFNDFDIKGYVTRIGGLGQNDISLFGTCRADEIKRLTNDQGQLVTSYGKDILYCPETYNHKAWLIALKRKELGCEINKSGPEDAKTAVPMKRMSSRNRR